MKLWKSLFKARAMSLMAVLFTSSLLFGQTTIGGSIYSGRNFGPGPDFTSAPALNNARVMVQNQHSGGAWIAYGTVTGNTWSATVPDNGDYVIMFSAAGHDMTSRQVSVDAVGNVTHPKQTASGIVLSADPTAIDAYLPQLFTNPDGTPSPNELPLANLLVFSFYDMMVNGEPDLPDDFPLNGVTWTVCPEEDYPSGPGCQTGVSGSQNTIVASDGQQICDNTTNPGSCDGLYYFTNLEPGEVIATSDPTTIFSSGLPQPAGMPTFTASSQFYLNYTEEGGPSWDPKLYPGDPGTEAGGFLIWHSYVLKLGNDLVTGTGKITGTLDDADKPGLDPAEPFPIPGEDHPGVTLNTTVPDGLVILFTTDETIPTHPVATVEADANGYFEFLNVPAGSYKMMMFDVPLKYVWTQQQVTVLPNQTVNFAPNTLLVPRFFARGQGFVYELDHSVSPPDTIPMANQEVHVRFKSGSIQDERTTADGAGTDPTGWYNFDALPEIEVMGHVDVAEPAGYRGAIITENFYPNGRPGNLGGKQLIINPVTHNSANRYIIWFTANYQADLYLEKIPSGVGQIDGYVFNDHFSKGSWTGDGIYDPDEERSLHGVTVELYDATMTLVATTTTGKVDEATLKTVQGMRGAYVWPADEAGGVFVGPQIGFYEFRDVAPGTYTVKIIPPAGYSAVTGSPALGQETVVVTGSEPTVPANGDLHQINFGVNTLPSGTPNVSVGAPLAGEIEGGVFDDLNIDPRGGSLTPDPTDLQSLLFAEKAGVDHAPVGVYDHLGYLLGVGIMGNPLCYANAPPNPVTGDPQCPDCDQLFNLVQKPEMEGRFAPGVHIYVGNDPAFTRGEDLNCNGILDPGEDLNMNGILDPGFWPTHPDWGYNAGYLPLILPYTFGQGKFKFEADWSLVPVSAGAGLAGPIPGNGPILPANAPVINNPVGPMVAAGDVINLQGQNFGDRQGHSTVLLNGDPLPVLSWSDTNISVRLTNESIDGSILVATSTGISNGYPVQIDMARALEWWVGAHSVWVDASNTGPQNGTKTNPYRTITQALNNLPVPSRSPRMVFVAPGIYNERIHIAESDVYIIGAGPRETILDGLTPVVFSTQGVSNGGGPVVFIGAGGLEGSVSNVRITGLSITGGTVNDDDIGCGIFLDFGNDHVEISDCMIYRNGGYYGGGIWGHRSNKFITIHSNIIAENGNFGGYGGGISFNDEPDEYEEPHGEPEHVLDDNLPLPEAPYVIYNNLIHHNFSADSGGGITLYETKGYLKLYGNVLIENKAEDHGGAMFFEDTGPIDIFDSIFLRNYSPDDGGAISFEDVGNKVSTINVFNNLIAENIADDHGENYARGGALAFDDTFYGHIYNNTITGNIVAGSEKPAGGGIDSERNGHEYNGTSGEYMPPGYSNPEINNNIIWNNWKLGYDQPVSGEEEDLPYTWGENYVWSADETHVDNPALQPSWQSYLNSQSFTEVNYNDIRGGYVGSNNIDIDPSFVDPSALNWRLQAGSAVIDKAFGENAPDTDLELFARTATNGLVDMGAFEWHASPEIVVRIPSGILGAIVMPIPGSTSLFGPASWAMGARYLR